MRSIAMLATLSILAIWSSSADAGCVVYREPCGYYGKVCRPHGGPVGRFCPAGRGSNIDTMGEVCPWVRIGRRTGISHNSASWSAIQAAPDAAALPSQRLPRDRSKPRKPLWESRGVAIDVARLLGLSSGALPQILAPQTPAGLFLCN